MRSINDLMIKRSIYFAGIIVLLFYLTGCQQAPTSSGAAADLFSQKISGHYDGCGIGVFLANDPALTTQEVDLYESKISREVSVVMLFINWGEAFSEQDPLRDACDMIRKRGSIPMITWQPPGSLDNIINGNEDVYIIPFAANTVSYGKPIFIRFGHEMNGNWYTWSGSRNGSDEAATNKYINAWKHVHDIFNNAGATNVNWVWCVNRISVPDEPWNAPEKYYPGDNYVDWVGFDGYAGISSSDNDPTKQFSTIYSTLESLYPNKPMMIGEMACGTFDATTKPEWISKVFYDIEHQWTNIKLYVWFNINKTGQASTESDWTVDSSGTSPVCLASFEAAMNNENNDYYYYSSIFPPTFEPYTP